MQRNKSRRNICTALLLLAAGYSYGQNAQKTNALSVKQAVYYAMQNSVQVRNALLDIQIQKQTNKDITSAAFPQLSGNVSLTDYLDLPTSLVPAEFTGGTPGT